LNLLQFTPNKQPVQDTPSKRVSPKPFGQCPPTKKRC